MNINKIIIKTCIVLFILYLSINVASAVNMTERSTNCAAILDYEGITTLVGSLMLMIFGFSFIIYALELKNPPMILFGIGVIIVGFAGLLMGNYIFAVIFNALC